MAVLFEAVLFIPPVYHKLELSVVFQVGLAMSMGYFVFLSRHFGPMSIPQTSYYNMLIGLLTCAEAMAVGYLVDAFWGGKAPLGAGKAIVTSLLAFAVIFAHSLWAAASPARKMAGVLLNTDFALVAVAQYRFVDAPLHRLSRYLAIFYALASATSWFVSWAVLPTSTGDSAKEAIAAGARGVARVAREVLELATGDVKADGTLAAADGESDLLVDIDVGLRDAAVRIHVAAHGAGLSALSGLALAAAARRDADLSRRAPVLPAADAWRLAAVLRGALALCSSMLYLFQTGTADLSLLHKNREAVARAEKSFSHAADALADALARNEPVDRGVEALEDTVRTLEGLAEEAARTADAGHAMAPNRLVFRLSVSTLVSVVVRLRQAYRLLPAVLGPEQPSARRKVAAMLVAIPDERLLRMQRLLDAKPLDDADAWEEGARVAAAGSARPSAHSAAASAWRDGELLVDGEPRDAADDDVDRARGPGADWPGRRAAAAAASAPGTLSVGASTAAGEAGSELDASTRLIHPSVTPSSTAPSFAARARDEPPPSPRGSLLREGSATFAASAGFPPPPEPMPCPSPDTSRLSWTDRVLGAAARTLPSWLPCSRMGVGLGVQLCVCFAVIMTLHACDSSYHALKERTVLIVIPTFVLVEPSSGASVRKSVGRILGTALGAGIAFAIVYLTYACNGASYANKPQKFVFHGFFTAIASGLQCLACARWPADSNLYNASLMAMATGITAGYLGDEPLWSYVLWRSIMNFLGAAIVSLVTAVVLPVRSSDLIADGLAGALGGLADTFDDAVERFGGRKKDAGGRDEAAPGLLAVSSYADGDRSPRALGRMGTAAEVPAPTPSADVGAESTAHASVWAIGRSAVAPSSQTPPSPLALSPRSSGPLDLSPRSSGVRAAPPASTPLALSPPASTPPPASPFSPSAVHSIAPFQSGSRPAAQPRAAVQAPHRGKIREMSRAIVAESRTAFRGIDVAALDLAAAVRSLDDADGRVARQDREEEARDGLDVSRAGIEDATELGRLGSWKRARREAVGGGRPVGGEDATEGGAANADRNLDRGELVGRSGSLDFGSRCSSRSHVATGVQVARGLAAGPPQASPYASSAEPLGASSVVNRRRPDAARPVEPSTMRISPTGPAASAPVDEALERVPIARIYDPSVSLPRRVFAALRDAVRDVGPADVRPEDGMFGPAAFASFKRTAKADLVLSRVGPLIPTLSWETLPWRRMHSMTPADAFVTVRTVRHLFNLITAASHDLDAHGVDAALIPPALAPSVEAAFAQSREALRALSLLSSRRIRALDAARIAFAAQEAAERNAARCAAVFRAVARGQLSPEAAGDGPRVASVATFLISFSNILVQYAAIGTRTIYGSTSRETIECLEYVVETRLEALGEDESADGVGKGSDGEGDDGDADGNGGEDRDGSGRFPLVAGQSWTADDPSAADGRPESRGDPARLDLPAPRLPFSPALRAAARPRPRDGPGRAVTFEEDAATPKMMTRKPKMFLQKKSRAIGLVAAEGRVREPNGEGDERGGREGDEGPEGRSGSLRRQGDDDGSTRISVSP